MIFDRLNKLKRQNDAARFTMYYRDLLADTGLGEIASFSQHKGTTRLAHSVAVAYFSFAFFRALGMSFHEEDLIRGALLHDYYTYDTQDPEAAPKDHWKSHPETAVENASKEVELSPIEEEIIRKHMFPVTKELPGCKEAVVVSVADKLCAVYEYLCRENAYRKLRSSIMGEGAEALIRIPRFTFFRKAIEQ